MKGFDLTSWKIKMYKTEIKMAFIKLEATIADLQISGTRLISEYLGSRLKTAEILLSTEHP